MLLASSLAQAQTLVAVNDSYGVPFGTPLQVEPVGVLANDTLDGQPASEVPGVTVTVELVSPVSQGTLSCPTDAGLALCPDGSFDYMPGAGFDGSDSFTYRALATALGAQSSPATVTLSSCTEAGDPQVFECWEESAFLARLKQLGYTPFREGFEGAAWDVARSPVAVQGVDTQGITWTSNHPVTNGITTGNGAARTGSYGIYDPDHGYVDPDLNLTVEYCNVDVPPPECLFHDGVTGSAGGGRALHAVGAYVRGTAAQASVAIVLDDLTEVAFPKLPSGGFFFFGLIDARPAGFTKFEFREIDSKFGQKLSIWLDDFTMARSKSLFYFNTIQGAL